MSFSADQICLRKFVLAAIGVFGGQLQDLQVHFTSAFLMLIILATAVMRPFDHGEYGKILQTVELASLVATWLTLWAGAVFISYPKCRRLTGSDRNIQSQGYDQLTSDQKGQTLAWCDGIAVGAGMIDILVVVVSLCLLIHDQWERKKRKDQQARDIAERNALVEMITWSSNPGTQGTISPKSVGRQSSHSDSSKQSSKSNNNRLVISVHELNVNIDDDDDDREKKPEPSPRWMQILNLRDRVRPPRTADLARLGSEHRIAVALSPSKMKTKRKTHVKSNHSASSASLFHKKQLVRPGRRHHQRDESTLSIGSGGKTSEF